MAGLTAWVYSKPFGDSEGGGDVHYVSSCATGRITRLMLAELDSHRRIDVKAFWERRARRLLPALLFTLCGGAR